VLPEQADERLYDVTAFAGHVVTTLRRDTVLMARAYRLTDQGALTAPVDLPPAYAHGTFELGDNELFETTEVHVSSSPGRAPGPGTQWTSIPEAGGACTGRPCRITTPTAM
jgi:hypothetical protein